MSEPQAPPYLVGTPDDQRISGGIPHPGGESPIFADVFRGAQGEDYVFDVRRPQTLAAVPEPDVTQFDPIPAPPVRAASYPLAFTVRPFDQWSKGSLDGEHGEFVAGADAAFQQDMEPVERLRSNSFRIQPGPWDEALVAGNRDI